MYWPSLDPRPSFRFYNVITFIWQDLDPPLIYLIEECELEDLVLASSARTEGIE